jgi:hypothetical protein
MSLQSNPGGSTPTFDLDIPPPLAARNSSPRPLSGMRPNGDPMFVPLSAPVAAWVEQPLAEALDQHATKREAFEVPSITADYSVFDMLPNYEVDRKVDHKLDHKLDHGAGGLFDVDPLDLSIRLSPNGPATLRAVVPAPVDIVGTAIDFLPELDPKAARKLTGLLEESLFDWAPPPPAPIVEAGWLDVPLAAPTTSSVWETLQAPFELAQPETFASPIPTTITPLSTETVPMPAETVYIPFETAPPENDPLASSQPFFRLSDAIKFVEPAPTAEPDGGEPGSGEAGRGEPGSGQLSAGTTNVPESSTAEIPMASPTSAALMLESSEPATPGTVLGINPIVGIAIGVNTAPPMVPTSRRIPFAIDWRLIALAACAAGYVPLLVRSLLDVRPSNALGFTVVAPLLLPLLFVVMAARRPRRKTIDDRHVDLVVGLGVAGAALVTAHIVPGTLGSGASLWRADWLSLPLALFATYVLLWGVRFAWDLRNTVLVAALASPIAATPLLEFGWLPLGGQLNSLAVQIARYVTPVESVGFGRYLLGLAPADKSIDLRGLVDGRNIVLALFIALVAALLASRVDGRALARGNSVGPTSAIERRSRKFGVFVGCLATWWIVDLLVTTLALMVGGFTPAIVGSVLSSVAIGIVPVAIAAWSFRRWVRTFKLFLPTLAGVFNSPTVLPAHGPKSRADKALTLGALGLMGISAVATAMWPFSTSQVAIAASARPAPSMAGVGTMPQDVAPSIGTDPLASPIGWIPSSVVYNDQFHGYFGARAIWQRTTLQLTEGTPGVDQVNVDRITGPRQLMNTFGVTALYNLGSFAPVEFRTIDLSDGSTARQETFYDATTASTWSIVTFVVSYQEGSTSRISVSGRGFGDLSDVPLPSPSAFSNLGVRIAKETKGVGEQLRRDSVKRTSKAVAAIAVAQADAIRSWAAAGELTEPQVPSGTPIGSTVDFGEELAQPTLGVEFG